MKNEALITIFKGMTLTVFWFTLSPLLLIFDGRWKLLPKWLRIVLFVVSPLVLVLLVAIAFFCYAYYWDYYYPRHHFVQPKVVENIIGLRLPKYKVVEYDKDRRSFNGDYSDRFTLEFKRMPNDAFYDELDRHFRKYIPTRQQLDSISDDEIYLFSRRAEIKDSTIYKMDCVWIHGLGTPEGEPEWGDYWYTIRIEKGSKTFRIEVTAW